ncbi:MAG: SusC/RagA family TonB-linked outer membrane protein, partial [Bacteroidales bacterium]|nr:SusC/RagA family TonB-linked outer membrane protein [Bacteroidales bacterium]
MCGLLLFLWGTMAAQVTVRGTVTDISGTLPGATIAVKGHATAVISGSDGNYTITVPDGNAVLVFSFLGYTTQEIAVGSRAVIDVMLQEVVSALDEVVVVGYGTQKKRDLTGAISSVKVAEMPVQTYSTISHALAGKAAGLQVTQTSAQVGGGAKFRIRGETSTGAGNEPLIIIDGFPVSATDTRVEGEFANGSTDNLLESLNPNDIESIEILKDASSTAIYGSRAGHGVIIVTTKRGKEQKPAITYSGNATVQTISKHYDMLNAREFMVQRNVMMYEEYLRENALSVYAPYVTLDAGHITPDFVPLYSEQEIANVQETDWIDEITRIGIQQSHNISMTGGNELTHYLVSANYFKQDGIIKNDGMTRFTARINLDQRISRFVKVGVTLSLSQNQYQNIALDGQYSGVLSSAVQFNPTIPVYNADGTYAIDRERLTADNPVALLDITDNSSRDRLLGMAYIEVEPIKGLTLKASLGADRRNAKRETYYPKTVNVGKAQGGWANISESDARDYLMDLTATYTNVIGAHNFTALAGYSWQGFSNKGVSAGNREFLFDNFTVNNLGFGNAARPGVGSWADKNALGSYFARVNYSFLGRYLLTATVRADGDSDFNPDYRWGYFPSASLGWRFSDEAFMQPFAAWLSNGKLRVSYGQTGNSNVGNRILDTYG